MLARSPTITQLVVTRMTSGSIIFEAEAYVAPSTTMAELQTSIDVTVENGSITAGQTTIVLDPSDATVSGKSNHNCNHNRQYSYVHDEQKKHAKDMQPLILP